MLLACIDNDPSNKFKLTSHYLVEERSNEFDKSDYLGGQLLALFEAIDL